MARTSALFALAALLALAVPASALYQLKVEGTYETKLYDEDAAEHIAYNKADKSIVVVNKNSKKVDVIDIKDVTKPTKTTTLNVDSDVKGTELQAVAVAGGVIAVACVADPEQDDGKVAFYEATAPYKFIKAVAAGPHPEGIAASPDETMIVVANEAVPDKKYEKNPKGSITLYDISDPKNPTGVTYDFSAFTDANALRTANPPVHIFGPQKDDPTRDLEPESAVFSRDGKFVYVSLQDNNALAAFDVTAKKFVGVFGMGYVDMEMDASDKSDGIQIQKKWPNTDAGVSVKGMPQADGIDSFTIGGKKYVFTANEGDTRDEGFKCIAGENKDVDGEEARLKDVGTTYANDKDIIDDKQLGRSLITTCFPAALKNDKIDGQIYVPGGRGFSIYEHKSTGLERVWDSGSQFEKKLEQVQPKHFNADGDSQKAKTRSDAKGCEPEGVVVGKVSDGPILAFVGLERIGGVMVYDVSDPSAPVFQDYMNNRNFCDTDLEKQVEAKKFTHAQGDISPEGMVFIPKADSPAGKDLLVVSNALSGTTTVYSLTTSSTARTDDGSFCVAPPPPAASSAAAPVKNAATSASAPADSGVAGFAASALLTVAALFLSLGL